MSTTAQRAFERLAKSVTMAFDGFRSDGCLVNVECKTAATKSAGMAGTGLRLRIGDRELTVDEGGSIVALTEAGKSVDINRMPRDLRQQERPTQPKLTTEPDWTGNG